MRANDIRFECRWHLSHRSLQAAGTCWQSIDVTVQSKLTHSKLNGHIESPGPTLLEASSSPAVTDFLSCLQEAALAAPHGQCAAAKIIVPRVPGYAVRSDIIPLRMIDCPRLMHTQVFADAHHCFTGAAVDEEDLIDPEYVFATAIAGLIFHTSETLSSMIGELDAIESELRHRLAFPWIVSRPLAGSTLAFVGNYLQYPDFQGTGANHYSTAKALGISLVLLDEPGCWLEDSKYDHLRQAFIPVSLKRDGSVGARILEALSQFDGRIDGIVTFHESLAAEIAQVAEALSLPTLSPTGFSIASDKYTTRVAEGQPACIASGIDDALSLLGQSGMEYPLIIKPCHGGASEGVTKANNPTDMAVGVAAIQSLVERYPAEMARAGGTFVIEEYCEGPEVDVNFVLWGGEILLCEICDEMPKTGDTPSIAAESDDHPKGFSETAMTHPSTLPPRELNLLRSSIHATLVRHGLHTGVFHCEARVRDSAMAYSWQDGIEDLHYRQQSARRASSWLLEINPRPPGKASLDAVLATYGIDYVGLAFASALRDLERVKSLSQTFAQGPQYHCQALVISADKAGIFDSDDPSVELKHRRPDLARHISSTACYLRRGDVIRPLGVGSSTRVSHLIVFSRVSRAHLLVLCDTIRREIRFSII